MGQAILNFGGYLTLYESFAFAMTYIFCRKHPSQQFSVLFILKLKAVHFPWFYLFFRVITDHGLTNLLVGLVAGHAYIYFKEILPLSSQKDYLQTPVILFINK